MTITTSNSLKLHSLAIKMAGTLTFLLVCSLLQGALCGTFNIKMPKNINVLRGSCVTIPCSFDVDSDDENNLDDTCKAYWSDSLSFNSVNAKLKPTKDMTGDLTKKDCTTFFSNASLLQRSKYNFRLECNGPLKYTFGAGVDISLTDDPPSPTLTPSTLEVKEGASVSLTCSAPAPCWSHPPALTWTPNLGQSQETLQENQDKTKVKTSVISFNASHLHHGNKISCTAAYQKQDGSPDVTAETSLSPDITYSPKYVQISVSPSCPVPENNNVTLTCSSNANPAVANYTWYRADGDQENYIGTGTSLNIKVSKDRRRFFCKAENEIGVGRSNLTHLDVQCCEKHCGFYSGVLPWVLAGVFFSISVICAAFLWKVQKNVKPQEEDRTYMSLNRRNVGSSEYDVINTAPKWKVYDRHPHEQMALLAAMDAACDDITAGSCTEWIRHSRRYFPRCIARDNICCDLHMSENRITNYQSLTPGGCVAEWGKTVRHMNRLVVYLGLLFRTMLPPHRQPAALFPQLLGVCRRTASGAYAIFGCTSYRGLASYG
ncbi:ATPase family AAA domain-containing protein 2 [Sarotherodon galilaeus]